MNTRGNQIATVDDIENVTTAMYTKGLIVSIAVGLYYLINAFMPITAWFGWIKKEFDSTSTNKSYKYAWLTLVYGHLIVFSPMALLWPFTYIGSGVVVEFWDLANWWLGTLTASSIVLVVSIMWIIAATSYEDTSLWSKQVIWLELAVYVLLELLGWYGAIFNYPMAHNWFYYANKELKKDEKTEDTAGKIKEVDINGNDLEDFEDNDLQPIDF